MLFSLDNTIGFTSLEVVNKFAGVQKVKCIKVGSDTVRHLKTGGSIFVHPVVELKHMTPKGAAD